MKRLLYALTLALLSSSAWAQSLWYPNGSVLTPVNPTWTINAALVSHLADSIRAHSYYDSTGTGKANQYAYFMNDSTMKAGARVGSASSTDTLATLANVRSGSGSSKTADSLNLLHVNNLQRYSQTNIIAKDTLDVWGQLFQYGSPLLGLSGVWLGAPIDTNQAVLENFQSWMDGKTHTFTGTWNGALPWTELERAADTTHTTGSAFVDLGTLQFVMATSGVYEIEGKIYTVRATAANGWTLALNLTQAPTNVNGWGIGNAATSTQIIHGFTTYLDSLVLVGTTQTTGDAPTTLNLWIVNTGSATNFKLRFHSAVATNLTIKRGSYIRYRRLY